MKNNLEKPKLIQRPITFRRILYIALVFDIVIFSLIALVGILTIGQYGFLSGADYNIFYTMPYDVILLPLTFLSFIYKSIVLSMFSKYSLRSLLYYLSSIIIWIIYVFALISDDSFYVLKIFSLFLMFLYHIIITYVNIRVNKLTIAFQPKQNT